MPYAPTLTVSIPETCQGCVERPSTENLLYFVAGFQTTPKYLRPFLIPVFYARLVTTDIATLFHLETLNSEILKTQIGAIILCFPCVATLVGDNHVPPAAFVDLWPRVWAWIEALDKYREQLPASLTERLLQNQYEQSITLIRVFYARSESRPEVERLIAHTPGMRYVVGRAWASLLSSRDDQTPETNEDGINELALVLGMDELGQESPDSTYFQELVDGAGGSQNLALLVIRHLNHSFPSPHTPLKTTSVAVPGCLAFFLFELFHADTDYSLTLLEHGLVPALTTACRALAASTLPTQPLDLLQMMFEALTNTLEFRRSHRRIVESLQAGLLPLIFSCGSSSKLRRTSKNLIPLLEITLPGFTVYFSVLAQLQQSLDDVKDLHPETHLDAEPRMHWQRFITLVEERLIVVETYQSGSLTSLRACDNSKCAKIDEKGRLKRCSGCRSRYYCSRACQKLDYRDNEHRDDCDLLLDEYYNAFYPALYLDLMMYRLAADDCADYLAKDRSFFRALLNFDYKLRREEIARELLRFWFDESTSTSCYTLFDYTSGWCEVSVLRQGEYPPNGDDDGASNSDLKTNPDRDSELASNLDSPRDQDLDLALEEQDLMRAKYHWNLSRMRELGSRGHIQLHIMQILGSGQAEVRVVPLRLGGGELRTGLKEIALKGQACPGVSVAYPEELDLAPYRQEILRLIERETMHTHQ